MSSPRDRLIVAGYMIFLASWLILVAAVLTAALWIDMIASHTR